MKVKSKKPPKAKLKKQSISKDYGDLMSIDDARSLRSQALFDPF